MANSKLVKFKDKKGNAYPYLFIDELNGTFYAVKRIGDTVRKKPLGTDFNKARSLVLTTIQELTNTKQDFSKDLVKDFFEAMLEEKQALEIKSTTIQRINQVWENSLQEYWQFLKPEDCTQDQVTKFITWHRRKRPGIQFYNVFKYLNNIFKLMVERGAMPINQRPKLVIPKDEQKQHDKQKGRYITNEEFQKILLNLEGSSKLIVLIAYCTGMRKMEICALSKDRVEKINGRYIFKLDTDDTKTGLARVVPLPKTLTELVDEQMKVKSDYLFPMKTDLSRHISGQILDKDWIKSKILAGIKGRMRFHDLRHTAASNLAKDGINPVISVTMLGMSLAVFQKVYLKLNANDIIIASESNAARLGREI